MKIKTRSHGNRLKASGGHESRLQMWVEDIKNQGIPAAQCTRRVFLTGELIS